MRSLDPAETAAISAGIVSARNFVWIVGRDRDTGDPVPRGFWDDIGAPAVDVVDALTRETVSRVFAGDGSLLSVGAIALTADITVRSVSVTFSALHPGVAALVRGADVRLAPIQIYRGYFDPVKRVLVAAAKPRFTGVIDELPIGTPAAGEDGAAVTARCVSATRELTMGNPDVRSHESQRARHAGDDFYKDTAVVGEWDIAWGQTRGKVTLLAS